MLNIRKIALAAAILGGSASAGMAQGLYLGVGPGLNYGYGEGYYGYNDGYYGYDGYGADVGVGIAIEPPVYAAPRFYGYGYRDDYMTGYARRGWRSRGSYSDQPGNN